MPKPGKGEKKKDFIDRCIPIVIDDGTAKDGDQAVAICNSIWDDSKKREEDLDMYVKIDEIERRCLPTSELELRVGENEAPKIVGYAAVFNTWTDIGGWFREQIKPGAFAKTIRENDVRALFNHDEDFVLGRNKAKTLSLREDAKGLAVTIDPPGTGWANDLLVSMRRGDVNQMSFGFQVNKQEIDYEKDERTLLDVTLFDVSVVTYPAYPTTSAQVRSAFAGKKKSAGDPPSADGAGAEIHQDEQIPLPFQELDRIVAKIKSGEVLTSDEFRMMEAYLKDRMEKVPDPSKVRDRFKELLDRAEDMTS